MSPEEGAPSILKRRFSETWVGLALSIVAALVMSVTYANSDRAKPDSQRPTHQSAVPDLVVIYTVPAMILALLAFAVGLGTLIPRLVRRQNVAVPAITLAFCALSFALFAALWPG